jgi:hypothetical protein
MALLLVPGALLRVLAVAATISSALGAAQPHPGEPVQTIHSDDAWPAPPADAPLLIPAKEPSTRM